jgi:hypothetical protein
MSWEDLEKRDAQPSAEQDRWKKLHSAVFGTGPGAELLERYHQIIVDRAHGPSASEADLRFADAQRSLILGMQRLAKP